MKRNRVATLAVLGLLLLGARPAPPGRSSTAADPGDGAATCTWSAEYQVGTESFKKGANLDLSVTPEAITIKSRRRDGVSIPVAGLLGVTYDTVPHRPLDALQQPPVDWEAWEIIRYLDLVDSGRVTAELAAILAEVDSEELAFLAALRPPSIPSAPVLGLGAEALIDSLRQSNDRFVYTVWQEGGTVKDVLLRFDNEAHARDFLSGIRDETGEAWIDLPASRDRLFQELESRTERHVPIRLDRRARVGRRALRPGSYRLVVVEDEGGRASAYLFAGEEVRRRRLAAVAAVDVEPATEEAGPRGVVYHEGGGRAAISAIRLEDKTLRFPAPQAAGAPDIVAYGEAPAFRFEAERDWAALVSRARYKGEPALRFPVFLWEARSSTGFLYVTPTRLAYDPVFTPGSGDAVEASRDRVEEVRRGRMLGNVILAVELADERLTFRPLYESGLTRRPSISMVRGRRADEQFCDLFVQAFTDFESVQPRLGGALPPPRGGLR